MKIKYDELNDEKKAEIDEILETESETKLYTFDDTGNSQRFVDLYGDKFRFDHTANGWLYWDKTRWKYDNGGAIDRAINCSVERMGDELAFYQENGTEDAFQKHIKYSRSHKGKTACEAECRPLLPVNPKQLDRHKFAFNTLSGEVSLKNGKIFPHKQEDFITKISPYEISETADCPIWEKFLDEIFLGDKDLIRFVKKSVGYSLTGSMDEQCLFFLYGDGCNGKSTFLNAVSDILGEYSMNVQPSTLMLKQSNSGGASPDIARLRGARFVTSAEPNEGQRLDEGLIKQLTGGDKITTRPLYGKEFEYFPEFKLWIATNHRPIIRGVDKGIWRRIRIIPFFANIPEERIDRRLGDKLKAEYPAILRWAVDGCLLWQSEGLTPPKAVTECVDEYRREMDGVSAFIQDRCVLGDDKYVKASELYAEYESWCDDGNEYKLTNRKFCMEIGNRFGKKKLMNGVFYYGIAIG